MNSNYPIVPNLLSVKIKRDLAIIALLLASGVRLSEAVNLDLKDVNLNMMVIELIRKGKTRFSECCRFC